MADPAELDRKLHSIFAWFRRDKSHGSDIPYVHNAYSLRDVELMGPFRCHSEPLARPAHMVPAIDDAIRSCAYFDHGTHLGFGVSASMVASKWVKAFMAAGSAVRQALPEQYWPPLGHSRGFDADCCCEDYFARGEYREQGHIVGEYVIERSEVTKHLVASSTATGFPARPGHWTAIIRDGCDDSELHSSEYILRSEFLASLCLLRRQMNKDFGANMFQGWELDVNDGPIKATVITFTSTRVRIVQAACIPTLSREVVFTYRGTYPIGSGLATWDADVSRNVVRWMMCPDEPLFPPIEEAGREAVQATVDSHSMPAQPGVSETPRASRSTSCPM